jgi:hypothetical protein
MFRFDPCVDQGLCKLLSSDQGVSVICCGADTGGHTGEIPQEIALAAMKSRGCNAKSKGAS